MPGVRFLAIDPALRNLGIALMELEQGHMSVVDLALIQTGDESGKSVRKSSDDLRRACELHAAIARWAKGCAFVVAEIPSGSQSSRASLGAGVVIGVLAGIASRHALIEVSPAEAKRVVTGRSTATKDEIIAWATKRWPDAPWIKHKRAGAMVIGDKNEHLADACAIGLAGIQTPAFRAATGMMRGAEYLHEPSAIHR